MSKMTIESGRGWYDANSNEFIGKRLRGVRKADSMAAVQGIIVTPDGRRVYWQD